VIALAAVVHTVAMACVVAFQVALALGAPWGAYAMGGAVEGRYPPAMRVLALAQAVVLAALALVVLSAADIAAQALVDDHPWLAWVPVAVSAVAVVLNAISRSARERRLWVPVALLLLASSLVVALASGGATATLAADP
jgi:cytochrome bd-type quinol oxidase subunit 2